MFLAPFLITKSSATCSLQTCHLEDLLFENLYLGPSLLTPVRPQQLHFLCSSLTTAWESSGGLSKCFGTCAHVGNAGEASTAGLDMAWPLLLQPFEESQNSDFKINKSLMIKHFRVGVSTAEYIHPILECPCFIIPDAENTFPNLVVHSLLIWTLKTPSSLCHPPWK